MNQSVNQAHPPYLQSLHNELREICHEKLAHAYSAASESFKAAAVTCTTAVKTYRSSARLHRAISDIQEVQKQLMSETNQNSQVVRNLTTTDEQSKKRLEKFKEKCANLRKREQKVRSEMEILQMEFSEAHKQSVKRICNFKEKCARRDQAFEKTALRMKLEQLKKTQESKQLLEINTKLNLQLVQQNLAEVLERKLETVKQEQESEKDKSANILHVSPEKSEEEDSSNF